MYGGHTVVRNERKQKHKGTKWPSPSAVAAEHMMLASSLVRAGGLLQQTVPRLRSEVGRGARFPSVFRTRAVPIGPWVLHWGLYTQWAGEEKGDLEYGDALPLLLPQPGGGRVTGLGHIGETSHKASAGCLGNGDSRQVACPRRGVGGCCMFLP